MSEWTYCRTLLDMLPLPRLHAGFPFLPEPALREHLRHHSR